MLLSAAVLGPRACMCIYERVKERFISANVHVKSASWRAFALELLHTTLYMCVCACQPPMEREKLPSAFVTAAGKWGSWKFSLSADLDGALAHNRASWENTGDG